MTCGHLLQHCWWVEALSYVPPLVCCCTPHLLDDDGVQREREIAGAQQETCAQGCLQQRIKRHHYLQARCIESLYILPIESPPALQLKIWFASARGCNSLSVTCALSPLLSSKQRSTAGVCQGYFVGFVSSITKYHSSYLRNKYSNERTRWALSRS